MSFEEKLRRFRKLYEDMEKKMAQDDLFNKEFTMLKARSLQWKNDGVYPADAGSVPINRKKNRFKDILPFEYTRVQLHMIEGIEHSDYINANYINGPTDEVEYIAAQGPLPHTVGDFWRMLWYHNIEIVIMACREVEMGKAKCEKYWTEIGETKEYGPISVTCTKEEKLTEDVMVRDLSANCEGEVQLIRQYHYQTWPDHDKPAIPEPLINMLEKVRNYQKRKETPIVVHCSAGCGRTGTVISTDYIRTVMSTKNLGPDLSIFGIVETMRKQRPAMVQTKNQYHFLYIAAACMSQLVLTADVIPDKPTAPKPTFKKLPASTGNSSKQNYINVTKTPDYINTSNPEKDAVNQPDVSQNDEDPDDQMYGNQETILTTDDMTKPGNNLTNDPYRRPKPAPRAMSPNLPPVAPRTETGPPPVVPRTEPGGPPPVVPRTESGGPPPVVPRTEMEKKQSPAKPDRPKTFSSQEVESQVNTYSTVDYTTLKDKGPEISAVFEDRDKTVPFSVVQDVLDSSKNSVTSPNKSKNISDILMDILDDMDEPEATASGNFGGPGEYMMMDTDEIDSNKTPELPRRTEDSKHLLGEPKEEPLGDSLYCEPVPVWNSSPSKPPKIDDNVSNSPPSQRKALGPVSSITTSTPSKPSSKSNILSIFRNKGGQTASTRHKKITPAEISAPVGPLSKGPPPEGLAGLANRPPVQIISPMGRAPGIVLSNPGSVPASTSPHNTLGRTPTGGVNSKYNFPGELGFGKRVQKPKGPRKEPDSWSRWNFAS